MDDRRVEARTSLLATLGPYAGSVRTSAITLLLGAALLAACEDSVVGSSSDGAGGAAASAASGVSSGPDTGTGGSPATFPPFGVVGIPRGYRADAAGWGEVLDTISGVPVGVLSVGYVRWSEGETSDGVYDWSDFDALRARLDVEGSDLPLALDVGAPIGFDAELDLPPDLAFAGFDDEEIARRWSAYLLSSLEVLPGRTSWITIHTEGVLEYFDAHPDEQPAFCDLLADGIASLKSAAPDIAVGAYWRYENDDDDLFACVNRATDFVAVATILNPPQDELADFPEVVEHYLDLAGDKPLGLVEIGWPSSAGVGSSDAAQVAFVEQLGAVLSAHADRIAFASYYSLYDEDRAVMEQVALELFGDLESEAAQSFLAWITTLGLHREDGSAKPGWDAFIASEALR